LFPGDAYSSTNFFSPGLSFKVMKRVHGHDTSAAPERLSEPPDGNRAAACRTAAVSAGRAIAVPKPDRRRSHPTATANRPADRHAALAPCSPGGAGMVQISVNRPHEAGDSVQLTSVGHSGTLNIPAARTIISR
jgi:hypothetical protein